MLKIDIPDQDLWDDEKEKFYKIKSQTLQLEHSLISLAKWEAIWCKPFLTKQEKTFEETISYIKCMTINNVSPEVYYCLTADDFKKISDYISAPMTAQKFRKTNDGRGQKEIFTAELIYYYMISLNIPFNCQKWHLNRLLTLIRLCGDKNKPPKKMSQAAIARRNSALNAARRKKYHTKG